MKNIIFILAVLCSTGLYAQVNLGNGLLAYYPFSGNTNDASGNGNNATNFGATLTTDQGGNPNSAYYFDGVNDYMRIAGNVSLNLLSQVSLVAKVKIQGFYNGQCKGNCILDRIDEFGPGSLSLRFSPNNYTLSCIISDSVHQNYSTFYNGISPASALVNNAPYIQKDQWDCLVYTFDGSTHKLYVNSVLRYQYTGSSATTANTNDIFMGKKNDSQYPYWFKGVMDEVRIYNRALNIQEVDSLCSFSPQCELTAAFSDSVVNCFTRKFRDLSSTTGSGGIDSWSWSFDNLGSSSQQNPTFTFPGYGTYAVKLVVTSSGGDCADSITQNITIPYIPFADAGNDTTICVGNTARLQASGGVSYSWSPTAGLSDPSAAGTHATISGSTTYIVTVTDNKGCTDNDSVVISVSNSPVSILSDDNMITGCLDNPVQLHATGAAAYTWSPGIYCNDSTISSPKVKPPATTLFTVKGTDAGGCVSYDTVTVSVYYGSKAIFMPNAFSPNGDGRNDEIGPSILCGFTMGQFAVFNRWGQRIFSAADPSVKWNGTYKNKPADAGTYYYFIKGKKDDGTTTTFKGDLTLIR